MNKKLNRGLAIIIPDKKVNTFIMFIIILGIISGSLLLSYDQYLLILLEIMILILFLILL